MSAAYKCDRCGELYLALDPPKLNDIAVEKIAYGNRSYGANAYSDTLDLCERCAKEFVMWWKEPALAAICNGEG